MTQPSKKRRRTPLEVRGSTLHLHLTPEIRRKKAVRSLVKIDAVDRLQQSVGIGE